MRGTREGSATDVDRSSALTPLSLYLPPSLLAQHAGPAHAQRPRLPRGALARGIRHHEVVAGERQAEGFGEVVRGARREGTTLTPPHSQNLNLLKSRRQHELEHGHGLEDKQTSRKARVGC